MEYTTINIPKNIQNKVEKKMQALLEVCELYKIPMFSCAVTSNNENGTQYNNIVYGGFSHGVILKDDQIKKHILVADGFECVSPREAFEVNTDIGDLMSESEASHD